MKKSAFMKKLYRDNRGSAIVMVIIAMAMISVLAVTMVSMSYINYKIKMNDRKTKDSFYDAEVVMEQIMAGMQHEASAAISVAYKDVLKNWDYDATNDNHKARFMDAYVEALYKELENPAVPNTYDPDKLLSYVDNNLIDASGAYKGLDLNYWTGASDPGNPKSYKIELVNNSTIILSDIRVAVTDRNGYLSIVNTDISMDVPELIFEQSGSIDGLYDYSMIGASGIKTNKGLGGIVVDGSIYGGSDLDITNSKEKLLQKLSKRTNESPIGGIVINSGTSVTVKNGKYIISGGDITVNGAGSKLIVEEVPKSSSKVFAKDLKLNSGLMSLASKTYVANDATLSGTGSKLTVSKEYYGFGSGLDFKNESPEPDKDSIDPKKSSAIVINGTKSTVDFSEVTKLLLAGRAYIGTTTDTQMGEDSNGTKTEVIYDPTTGEEKIVEKKIPGQDHYVENQKTSPYIDDAEKNKYSKATYSIMGESIAIKGGQMAYLVPAECIGTVKNETYVGMNPLNADARALMEKAKVDYPSDASEGIIGFQEVDFKRKIYKLGNKSLSDYGITKMDQIRVVNARFAGSTETDKTLTYYYLALEPDMAAKYFEQYYNNNSNKQQIDRYFKTYATGGILLGNIESPNNQYTIVGNSLMTSAIADSGVALLRPTGVEQEVEPEPNPDEPNDPPQGPDVYSKAPDGIEKPEMSDNNLEIKDNRQIKTNSIDDYALEKAADINKKYASLLKTMTESGSDTGLADIFEATILNEDASGNAIENGVTDFIKNKQTKGGSSFTFVSDDGYAAILTTEKNFTIPADPSNAKIRLVVATGNVNVSRNFTGLILAKGEIKIESGVTVLNRDKQGLYSALNAKTAYKTEKNEAGEDVDVYAKPIDFFRNGGTTLNTSPDEIVVDKNGNLDIDLTEIVRYSNWVKK